VGTECELDCSSKKDIAFVLDASNSVGQPNFNMMLEFISQLVQDLTAHEENHRFSLITYSTNVQTVFSFDRYLEAADVTNAISTTQYQMGSTNTADALRQAILMFQPGFGSRSSADHIVMLMTDGQSNINYWDTKPAAQELKDTGARVLAVGIGLRDFDEVNAIASSSQDIFKVNSFKDLAEIEHRLLETSCRSR